MYYIFPLINLNKNNKQYHNEYEMLQDVDDLKLYEDMCILTVEKLFDTCILKRDLINLQLFPVYKTDNIDNFEILNEDNMDLDTVEKNCFVYGYKNDVEYKGDNYLSSFVIILDSVINEEGKFNTKENSILFLNCYGSCDEHIQPLQNYGIPYILQHFNNANDINVRIINIE